MKGSTLKSAVSGAEIATSDRSDEIKIFAILGEYSDYIASVKLVGL